MLESVRDYFTAAAVVVVVVISFLSPHLARSFNPISMRMHITIENRLEWNCTNVKSNYANVKCIKFGMKEMRNAAN